MISKFCSHSKCECIHSNWCYCHIFHFNSNIKHIFPYVFFDQIVQSIKHQLWRTVKCSQSILSAYADNDRTDGKINGTESKSGIFGIRMIVFLFYSIFISCFESRLASVKLLSFILFYFSICTFLYTSSLEQRETKTTPKEIRRLELQYKVRIMGAAVS